MGRPKDEEDPTTVLAFSIFQATICRRPYIKFKGDTMEVIPCNFCRVCRRRIQEEKEENEE